MNIFLDWNLGIHLNVSLNSELGKKIKISDNF